GTLTGKQHEILDACASDCDRLERLMFDLLDLSKIESGEGVPVLGPIRPRDLVVESAQSFLPQFKEKGITFSNKASPDLPGVLADVVNVMSKKILIIEDEKNIRRMVRLTLETAGYEVGEAQDGFEGLSLFGSGASWDVVLLDQKMAGIDGLETLRLLKKRKP